jgi:hypothetical protein
MGHIVQTERRLVRFLMCIELKMMLKEVDVTVPTFALTEWVKPKEEVGISGIWPEVWTRDLLETKGSYPHNRAIPPFSCSMGFKVTSTSGRMDLLSHFHESFFTALRIWIVRRFWTEVNSASNMIPRSWQIHVTHVLIQDSLPDPLLSRVWVNQNRACNGNRIWHVFLATASNYIISWIYIVHNSLWHILSLLSLLYLYQSSGNGFQRRTFPLLWIRLRTSTTAILG